MLSWLMMVVLVQKTQHASAALRNHLFGSVEVGAKPSAEVTLIVTFSPFVEIFFTN